MVHLQSVLSLVLPFSLLLGSLGSGPAFAQTGIDTGGGEDAAKERELASQAAAEYLGILTSVAEIVITSEAIKLKNEEEFSGKKASQLNRQIEDFLNWNNRIHLSGGVTALALNAGLITASIKLKPKSASSSIAATGVSLLGSLYLLKLDYDYNQTLEGMESPRFGQGFALRAEIDQRMKVLSPLYGLSETTRQRAVVLIADHLIERAQVTNAGKKFTKSLDLTDFLVANAVVSDERGKFIKALVEKVDRVMDDQTLASELSSADFNLTSVIEAYEILDLEIDKLKAKVIEENLDTSGKETESLSRIQSRARAKLRLLKITRDALKS